MKQKKKILTIVIASLCVALVAVGAIFGVRTYLKNRISFTVNDTLPDGEGKKARVILLGGQSNASGCSNKVYLEQNVSGLEFDEYINGYNNVHINYFASGANESQGFVRCVVGQGEAGGYFGPELGLAQKLNEMYPDEEFFIIKYAWGGTNLYEQWLSPSSDGKTGKLYRAFVAFVEASMEYLVEKNYDVSIEGMCWMQGESDSFSTEDAGAYGEHLSNFIADLRKRFDKYADDDGIAFVDAYIADNPMYWVYCDIVNEQKRVVAEQSPMNVVVDTIAAGLSCSAEPPETPDMAHYDSLSEIKLGHMFAEAVAKFFD